MIAAPAPTTQARAVPLSSVTPPPRAARPPAGTGSTSESAASAPGALPAGGRACRPGNGQSQRPWHRGTTRAGGHPPAGHCPAPRLKTPGLAARDLRPMGHLTSGRLDRTLIPPWRHGCSPRLAHPAGGRPVLHVVMQAQAALPPLPPATSWTVNLQQPHMQMIKSSEPKEQPSSPGHGRAWPGHLVESVPTPPILLTGADPCEWAAGPESAKPIARHASVASYKAVTWVGLGGLERPTSSLSGRRHHPPVAAPWQLRGCADFP